MVAASVSRTHTRWLPRYAPDVRRTLSSQSEIRSYTVHFLPAEEGGYTVEVPRLPGCITEGDSFEEALANAHEAIALYLESLAARGFPAPDDEATVVTRVAVQAAG
jgi:predicted RNase H-like HicB family nuclease